MQRDDFGIAGLYTSVFVWNEVLTSLLVVKLTLRAPGMVIHIKVLPPVRSILTRLFTVARSIFVHPDIP